jgi:hypothetical protein
MTKIITTLSIILPFLAMLLLIVKVQAMILKCLKQTRSDRQTIYRLINAMTSLDTDFIFYVRIAALNKERTKLTKGLGQITILNAYWTVRPLVKKIADLKERTELLYKDIRARYSAAS